jgi:hypothetical protein
MIAAELEEEMPDARISVKAKTDKDKALIRASTR